MSTAENPLNRRLLFVTGKGGVGKSTVSAALAQHASRIGKTVLLVEVDAKGNLADFFEHEPVGFEPVEIEPNLHVMTMNTQDSLRGHAVVLEGPAARTARAGRQHVRLDSDGPARDQRNPDHGQDLLGAPRVPRRYRAVGSDHRRRCLDRPHRRPARRGPVDHGTRPGRHGSSANRLDDRVVVRSQPDGIADCDHPRRNAGL
ncbi:MAG: AAA family ATPase [Acidimicrobiia bacterium]|nr:AAA family ATPase [Acidimicrobiia bacterium]